MLFAPSDQYSPTPTRNSSRSVIGPISFAASSFVSMRLIACARRCGAQRASRIASSCSVVFRGFGRSRTHSDTELFDTPSSATISSYVLPARRSSRARARMSVFA